MRHACALILVLFLCASARAADSPSRVLRLIDFEERRLGNPEDLPMHWAKVESVHMPHYVNGRLATDRQRSGQYSFRLDLNGGSLVYRYDARQVPVLPQSHYRVETYVQTTVLLHARARLTAYFVDADRRPIISSIRRSELYAAANPQENWKHLLVELSTGRLPATNLVVELELLQPELYDQRALGQRSILPQDIRGSAWFDDVAISQVPKVKLSTNRPGNIFRRGEPLSLDVLVSDRSTDDLAAQLVIRNAEGRLVHQRSGALDMAAAQTLGPGLKRMRLLLPPLPPGWYEAHLVMTSRGQFVGRQKLDLVHLADGGAGLPPDDRFGIIATDLPFDGWAEMADILPYLGVGRVKLAVWSRHADVQLANQAGFDQILVRLREIGVTPTACLLDLPPNIADRIRGDTWRHLLEARLEDWQPQLAYMIARHANHLDRWQLGADGTEAFVTDPAMRKVYEMIYGEFAKLVQRPDLAMPWPAWYEMGGQLPATVALSVHPSVLPHQLPLYMQDIRAHEGHNLSLTLQLMDAGRYGREVQIRDLAQRVICALAADARRIDIPLPFTVAREDEHLVKQPQELFMIVRTLMNTLGGAVCRGQVPIAEGVEAFLFDKNGQGILALWDRGKQGGVRQLDLTLGAAPRAVDLWGNVTPLQRMPAGRNAQAVQITVTPMPIFLIDIDGQLAQLRASLAFDRPLIESSFQPHTRKVRFVNPYRTSISGMLRLRAPTGWTITPPALAFSVNPGETFERDVIIEFPYNSFAGPKVIEATVALQDGQGQSTTVPMTLNLGLSDVGMQTLAMRDGQDVLVQQIITNYGDVPIDYVAFAIFPGHPRQERLVTNLGPGRSTIKLYRFASATGAAARLRTGVKELEGTRILNDEVEIR
jgi:hypothetical protein